MKYRIQVLKPANENTTFRAQGCCDHAWFNIGQYVHTEQEAICDIRQYHSLIDSTITYIDFDPTKE